MEGNELNSGKLGVDGGNGQFGVGVLIRRRGLDGEGLEAGGVEDDGSDF